MTTQPEPKIPEFTQGDRLRKARNLTGLTTRQFAEQIGVSQVTITNAENDNTKVRKITLNAWSLATGVPVEWLATGITPTGNGPDGGTSPTLGYVLPMLARRRALSARIAA